MRVTANLRNFFAIPNENKALSQDMNNQYCRFLDIAEKHSAKVEEIRRGNDLELIAEMQ